jgi:anaerobic dimethyl sulfoxide reductase subunit B (iron-sulfur subunit)
VAKQYGFYFDSDRCIQCRTCEVACESVHNLETGLKWRRVVETWTGEFPDVKISFLFQGCMHCGQPACETACPTGAISKRVEDGIVVVDRDRCNGCQECFSACPYDVPQFGSDGTMQKCDFCLGQGGEPACVAHCLTEALNYGAIENPSDLAMGKVAEKLAGPTDPSMIILHN